MKIGRITISEELLLQMLDFKGGQILDSRKDWPSGSVDFVIAHPDMPETPDNERARDVNPVYTQTDLGGIIRVERTEPPKS